MGMADACACDRLAEDKLLLNLQKLYSRKPIFANFASMKPTKFFACLFAAWFTLSLCCCDDRPSYKARLSAIDSIADTDAPLALAMLDSLKPHMAGATEADRNFYSLMRVKAEDKAFVTHKTDTLMLRLVDYYETDGDKALLPTAYYYSGRVYSDMNDGKRALQYFQKAVEMIDSSSTLYSAAYSQIGYLFLYQGIYDKGVVAFLRAYKQYKHAGNKLGVAGALCGMAYCRQRQGSELQALRYFKQAMTLVRGTGNKSYEADIIGQIANCYYNIGNYQAALKCARRALNGVDSINARGIYAIAADIYDKIGKKDTAVLLNEKLFALDDVYAKQTAGKWLGHYYLDKDVVKATAYIDEYNKYSDSIHSIIQTEKIAQIDAMYNYSLRETENIRLKSEVMKGRYALLISFILVVVVILSFTIFVLLSKKKRKTEEMKYEKEKHFLASLYEQSNAFIEENKMKIADLERQLTMSISNNESLTADLKAKQELLNNINKMAEIKAENRKLAETGLANSDICKKIITMLNDKTTNDFGKKLSVKDWLELSTEVNDRYPKFKERILELCEISELEYHVCLLLKVGVSLKSISVLTSKTKSFVSAIRKRLYFRAFGKSETPEKWDEFIHSL